MERKHPTKTIKTAAVVLLMLFGASTFAQNLPVICLPANQTTYNLKDDPTMKSIVDSLELPVRLRLCLSRSI